MLDIRDFSFGYPGQNNLLNNFYLNLKQGEKVILLGSNGVGKTSILRGIWEKSFEEKQNQINLPLEKAYFTQDIPATLSLKPLNPLDITFYELQYQMETERMLTQEASLDFEDQLISWLSEVVINTNNNFREKLKLNLFDLKLAPAFLSQKWKDLSSGTKKKLMLAILFATDPKLIIADEITNHLDKEAVDIVIDWIKKSSSTMLIIDHNQKFLDSIGNNFLVLSNNKERKIQSYPNMTFDEVMSELDELQSRQTSQLLQIKKKEKQLESNIKEFQRQASVFNSDSAGSKIRAMEKRLQREVYTQSVLTELDLRKQVNFGNKNSTIKLKKNILIEIEELHYMIGSNLEQYVKELKIYHGDRIRISGPNGRGKSSLIKMITNKIQGKNLEEVNEQYLSGSIKISNLEYQEFYAIEQVSNYPSGFTIDSYLQSVSNNLEWEVKNLLKRIELDKFSLHSPISSLSMGEFIRLQLGLLSQNLHKIKLLILDEPGNFLDIFTQKALIKMLDNYHGTLILITHDDKLNDQIEIDGEFILD
jgi:ATPase subunit of ABC transporter with duplicated ATPase domains